ncbi:MAG: hypothetical protein HWQ38_30375 [Nostoc sp. NMS7]|uniref:hypothetical protein n=1 Tax=Nostoc sp. NMS7 TaxID=2815391 RepID=UPI0025F4E4E5|nr:hypothetical protein [Nostoc sp. NMS7]MBN3950543.1 hypothetical protein [Nostoc sp. NMS7]
MFSFVKTVKKGICQLCVQFKFRYILVNFPAHLLNVDDPIKYFGGKENQDLGVVKAQRSPVSKLDLSPFPAPY